MHFFGLWKEAGVPREIARGSIKSFITVSHHQTSCMISPKHKDTEILKRENPTDFIKSVSSQKSERRNSDIFDLWLNKSTIVILQWNWPQLVGLWVWFVCVMRMEKLQASWVCTHQWSITTQNSLWWCERRRGQKEDVVLNLLHKTTPANYMDREEEEEE